MAIIPIRADNAYAGLAIQAAQGTGVAPTNFVRWMDGTALTIELTAEDIWEGDGSRRLSQIIKNKQMVKLKIAQTPRPILLGMVETAAMGKGSDSIVASTPSTTTTSVVTGGTSTTVTLTSGTGFFSAGAGTFQLMIGTGTATDPFEIVTFTVPTTLGTTQTVAPGYNGGKFKQSHPSGTNIASIAAVNTSFTSAATAGGTTVVVGNQNGITGTPTVILSAGLTTEEVVVLNASSVTGTGPWTYTLNGGATLKNNHAIGDTVTTSVAHLISDQADGNYYTWEVCLGQLSGAAGVTIRITDCKLDQLKVSGKAGSILMYEEDWSGIASVVQTNPSTVTFENHNIFLYAQGVWTLNGLTTGDALAFETFDITRKNNLDDTVQTEQLILAAIIFGNLNVDVAADMVYQNAQLLKLVYFGSTSGTTDAQAIGSGALSVTFTQADGFHSVTYALATMHYSKLGEPVPKKDGKHYKQTISSTGVSNQALQAFVMQTTVNNANYALYG